MKNYVKTMRSMVGTKPLLICGASVIVVRDGQILLQKRKDNGCWGYHGGCLEPGECLEDAARRELYEETGLRAKSMKLYGVFSGPELYYVYPHGDEVYNVDTVYVCEDFEGELRVDESEVSELKWYPFDEVPENLSPPVRGIIREFIKGASSAPRFALRGVDESSMADILDVYRQCEDFLSLGPNPEASTEMIREDLRLSRDSGGLYYGIYVADQIVGVVDFVPRGYENDSGHGHISLLMISKPWRSTGLGRAVLRVVEEEILADPAIKAIITNVQTNNLEAIGFWIRQEYRIISGPTLMPDSTTVYTLKKTQREAKRTV